MNMRALKESKNALVGGKGAAAQQFVLMGASGQDCFIKAPPGTVCEGVGGHVLGEVNKVGESFMVAQGGWGLPLQRVHWPRGGGAKH